MWNCTHFRHPTDEQLGHVDIFFSNYHNLQSVYLELLFDANVSHEGVGNKTGTLMTILYENTQSCIQFNNHSLSNFKNIKELIKNLE